MQFDEFDDPPAWGVASPQTADIVKDALRKEQVIKEITACQDDLRNMLARVQKVQKEVEKLSSGNETLQMYIDNLTVQIGKTTLILCSPLRVCVLFA